MSIKILMPALSPTMTDGKLVKWLKKEGDKVVMWYGSANRDEDIFNDGHLFKVDRFNAKKHLAFGAGEHLCLGNRLGHMQIKVLFEELLKRYPEIRSVADPIRVPSNFLAGISELKVKI